MQSLTTAVELISSIIIGSIMFFDFFWLVSGSKRSENNFAKDKSDDGRSLTVVLDNFVTQVLIAELPESEDDNFDSSVKEDTLMGTFISGVEVGVV